MSGASNSDFQLSPIVVSPWQTSEKPWYSEGVNQAWKNESRMNHFGLNDLSQALCNGTLDTGALFHVVTEASVVLLTKDWPLAL